MLRAVALLALCAIGLLAQTATGTLTVDDKTYKLSHGYAFQIPDWSDKTKMATLVYFVDREIPGKLLGPKIDPFALADAGVNGLKLEFFDGGKGYALQVLQAESNTSLSVSGTFDEERFRTFTPTRLEVSLLQEPKKVGDATFGYTGELTLDVKEAPPVVAEVEPTEADIATAQKTESAKAYLTFYAAMKKGDIDAVRKMVAPERAAMMNRPDFKEMFAMVQEMMPADVKIVKATENGDDAELALRGTMMGEARKGTVAMQRLDGKWLIVKESWKNN